MRTPERHLCEQCRKQRALYSQCGVVRADRQHTICFRCFRALMNHQRALALRQALLALAS